MKKAKGNHTTSTRKNIRFNDELLAEIDKVIGGDSFSTWVQNACREKIDSQNKTDK